MTPAGTGLFVETTAPVARLYSVLVLPMVQPGWLSALISARFENPPGSPSELAAAALAIASASVWPSAIFTLIALP